MIRPVALIALVLLAEPVLAQAPPLDTWKTVMNNAEEQFRAGKPMYACRHATNLAHFMNEEITKLQKRNASRESVRDVMWLEIETGRPMSANTSEADRSRVNHPSGQQSTDSEANQAPPPVFSMPVIVFGILTNAFL